MFRKIALAVTLGAVTLTSALPAQADGKDVLKGIAAVVVLGAIANQLSDGQPPRARYVQVTTGDTPAARAFHDLSPRARYAIETRLWNMGYLQTRADGQWDDATWTAVRDFAYNNGMRRDVYDYTGAMFIYEAVVA